MWPSMGPMGWWMALWWIFGVAVLALLVWAVTKTAGGFRGDDSPEVILKRRYAQGELEREEYQRRLEDLRR